MEKPFNFTPDPSQEVDAVNETSSSSETSSEESFLSYLRREAREKANATQMKKTPEFAEQVLLPEGHVLGACAGSKHAVGVNSECIPNIVKDLQFAEKNIYKFQPNFRKVLNPKIRICWRQLSAKKDGKMRNNYKDHSPNSKNIFLHKRQWRTYSPSNNQRNPRDEK